MIHGTQMTQIKQMNANFIFPDKMFHLIIRFICENPLYQRHLRAMSQ